MWLKKLIEKFTKKPILVLFRGEWAFDYVSSLYIHGEERGFLGPFVSLRGFISPPNPAKLNIEENIGNL